MTEFHAGSFSDVANSSIGKELWEILNERDNLIRMETATFLRRPAVEPLQQQLVDRFGKESLTDRHKQLIGRMVRQIMENQGYAFDQTGVKITSGILFFKGARYKKKED